MKVRTKRSSSGSSPATSDSPVNTTTTTSSSISPISDEVSREVKVEPEISSSEDRSNKSSESPAAASPVKLPVGDANSHCKLVQKQLVLLLHSHACLKKDGASSPEERPRCVVPNCQMMRGVWIHLKACEIGPSCSFRHCSSSQKILAHWKACRVMECRVCHIVRLKWAQMQVAKEAAAARASSSSSSARDNSSEESHLGESSSSAGQSTTSLSQGYGQGQGRLPHTMTIEQGSSRGGSYVVDNQLIKGDCGNDDESLNNMNYESSGNAPSEEEETTGSSSFLKDGQVISGFHTCHRKSSTLLLQQQPMYNQQQVQQQLLLQQLQRSSRYHRPAYHKLMADLPSHLQFQSQQNHQRHSHINVNNNSRQGQPAVLPVMRHYYDKQSVPPSLLMTMTLTRDDKSKRKIHDCLPCPSLNSKVRICCGGGHSSELPQSFSPIYCKCRVSDGNCDLSRHTENDSNRCFQHHQRLHRSSIEHLEASAGASFQDVIDETLGCARVNVPNSECEQNAPSANDVRKAYERLGIPCPSDALNRLLATLPGGSKYPSTASSSDGSSECGSEFDLQSSPAPSRRNSDDDGIEDEEYNTIEDDCQVSFCLSLVQRLVARKNDDDSHVDDTDDKSNS